MDDAERDAIAEATGAREVRRSERIQSLWSGYGELYRVELRGCERATAIVKSVRPPPQRSGARDDVSHARKCRSYEVETTWYRTLAPQCDEDCRVPALLGSRSGHGQWLLVLEDLDAAGFAERRRASRPADLDACLGWLAAFHARFLGAAAQGLWKIGTYWHLATRRDELALIDDAALREAAPEIDRKLRAATFQTLVHGDAKLANFCFASGGSAKARGPVAAVDFQYVGGGCGMKDVAYLLSGEAGEQRHLDGYFARLRAATAARSDLRVDGAALEAEWRALYPLACADFYRFLAGWSKEHWRHDAHGQRLVREVLRTLG